MPKRFPKVLSLTAALAALSGTAAVAAVPPTAEPPDQDRTDSARNVVTAKGEPNVFMSVGDDLLGLMVTKGADGTVVADHYSHVSHASHSSHSSHSSHYSSII